MAIHVHAQEWLTLISKVSRITLTQRRKTTKHLTTITTTTKRKKTHDPRHRPQEGRYTMKTSKRRRLEQGEAAEKADLAYKGSGVIDPHMDGPIAQPA